MVDFPSPPTALVIRMVLGTGRPVETAHLAEELPGVQGCDGHLGMRAAAEESLDAGGMGVPPSGGVQTGGGGTRPRPVTLPVVALVLLAGVGALGVHRYRRRRIEVA